MNKVELKPVSEMTLLQRLAFARFMPELIKQLEKIELQTQLAYKKLPNGTHLNTLVIISRILEIYNSPVNDHIACQRILSYLEEAAENLVFTLLFRAIAEEILKVFTASLSELNLLKEE
ncbi:hypothetical protein [uncultured Vagococcus sp.]|uniref:hypothetical protein n=1 Tax=uncultured Vagococcus sp. TaxID=189676 RepID=UPI00258E8B42|nr:hypothetical protein [uncultured Vagococcus sp.]